MLCSGKASSTPQLSNGGPAIDPLVLPPGFRACPGGGDPWAAALRGAAQGAAPGSVFVNGAQGRCRAAFLFAPDRPLGETELLNLGVLALFDALAVLAPPQVPVHVVPPDGLAVDGGRVATLRAARAAALADAVPNLDVPDWAVLGIDVAIDLQASAPGERPDQTCLAEEGFGDIAPADVLTHMSRHLLGWIDAWQEQGGAALQREVSLRLPHGAVAAWPPA
jgi:hypothetical protein